MKEQTTDYKRRTTALLLTLLAGLFLGGCTTKKTGTGNLPGNQPTALPTKTLEESISERPFVSLSPTADGHWVELEVKAIKEGTKSIDYELIYFAGESGNKIERGVAGSFELKNEKSFSRKILFGSESCTTGKCKYKFDENVSEGILSLKLRSDAGLEKFESAFRLQKGSEGKGGLTTGDGNFKFVSENIPKNNFFLTISTIGVPEQLPGKIAALPYGIFPSVSGKGEVSFKTSEETAKILFWDGTKWQELQGTLSDGWLTTSVQKTGIFVLVK